MENSDTEIEVAPEPTPDKRAEILKKAREKALQVRQAKAQEKKRVKDLENENNNLEKANKEQELV